MLQGGRSPLSSPSLKRVISYTSNPFAIPVPPIARAPSNGIPLPGRPLIGHTPTPIAQNPWGPLTPPIQLVGAEKKGTNVRAGCLKKTSKYGQGQEVEYGMVGETDLNQGPSHRKKNQAPSTRRRPSFKLSLPPSRKISGNDAVETLSFTMDRLAFSASTLSPSLEMGARTQSKYTLGRRLPTPYPEHKEWLEEDDEV
jgi:hypothetical protein